MWRILGASEIGTSHVKQGTPCQDAHVWSIVQPDCWVAAVADGLGSAKNSRDGAQIAVEGALRQLASEALPETDEGWKKLFEAAFIAARDDLGREASTRGEPIESFDTTLIVVASTYRQIATAHVGDGAVVGWVDDDKILTISAPERHEFLNVVTPITVADLPGAIRYSFYRGAVAGVCVMTDGLQSLSMNLESGVAFDGFFRPLFTGLQRAEGSPNVEELQAFLASDEINSRTTDDKTLLWATWSAL